MGQCTPGSRVARPEPPPTHQTRAPAASGRGLLVGSTLLVDRCNPLQRGLGCLVGVWGPFLPQGTACWAHCGPVGAPAMSEAEPRIGRISGWTDQISRGALFEGTFPSEWPERTIRGGFGHFVTAEDFFYLIFSPNSLLRLAPCTCPAYDPPHHVCIMPKCSVCILYVFTMPQCSVYTIYSLHLPKCSVCIMYGLYHAEV